MIEFTAAGSSVRFPYVLIMFSLREVKEELAKQFAEQSQRFFSLEMR